LSTIILYILTAAALIVSLTRDRKKTRMALKKALKSLNNILPQFITVLIIVSLILAVFDTRFISRFIGESSGFAGILGASLIGSVTLIPGFVAFPAAAELLRNGAGIAQLAAFVSSLMMVGIVTLPLETSFFGRKIAVARNLAAFLFSFGAAAFVAWGVSL
jgi:uncharacterized membrane protein YraQ (UPF0718 family)